MNVIQMRREDRLERIKEIEKSLLRSKNPDTDKLIMAVCSEHGISIRAAKEYLKVAQWRIENAK